VVDDGSTDDTAPRVAQWAQAHPLPITVLVQANAGPAAARNRGLHHARGEFIYFIDSDDLAFPSAIADMVAALRTSGRTFCIAGIRNAELDATPIPFDQASMPHYDPDCVVRSAWMMHGALYRRAALVAAGPFDEGLRCGEDSEYIWRVVATNGPACILKRTIGLRRVHGYGHLSFGRSDADQFRHAISAYAHFMAWAGPHRVMNRSVRITLVRNLLICSIKLGGLRCWEDIGAAQRAIEALGIPAGWRARLALLLTAPRWAPYYRFLQAAMKGAGTVRNGLMWLHASWQRRSWGSVAPNPPA
jgi:glycosyltransferase involved in cell wall biosynthesis